MGAQIAYFLGLLKHVLTVTLQLIFNSAQKNAFAPQGICYTSKNASIRNVETA